MFELLFIAVFPPIRWPWLFTAVQTIAIGLRLGHWCQDDPRLFSHPRGHFQSHRACGTWGLPMVVHTNQVHSHGITAETNHRNHQSWGYTIFGQAHILKLARDQIFGSWATKCWGSREQATNQLTQSWVMAHDAELIVLLMGSELGTIYIHLSGWQLWMWHLFNARVAEVPTDIHRPWGVNPRQWFPVGFVPDLRRFGAFLRM